MEAFFSILLVTTALYLVVGLIFYILFVRRGIHQIDPNAQGSTIFFKILIIPGTLAFWPILLAKWTRAKSK